MTFACLPIRGFLLLVGVAAAGGQSPTARPAEQTPLSVVRKPRPVRAPQPPFNVNVIFLDAAHGGADDGARLGPEALEKDATVAFVNRLRTFLAADGFTVVTTREVTAEVVGGPPAATETGVAAPAVVAGPPTLDQRVEMANRSRALACVLVHASSSGHGVHLYTSALTLPVAAEADGAEQPRAIMPWDTAQAPSLLLSQRLANDLGAEMTEIQIPLVTARVSVKPIDSMACPAVTLELAPLGTGGAQLLASDTAYQGRIARAVEAGLKQWRAQAEDDLAAEQMARDAAANEKGRLAAPRGATPPGVKPKPKVIPEEIPEVLTPEAPGVPKKPAPVIRKEPAPVPKAAAPPGAAAKEPGGSR